MSATRVLKSLFGLLLLVLGAWLIFYELAMAVSEGHAMHGIGIVFFACFLLIGLAIAFSGYRLLRPSRPRVNMRAGSEV